MIRVKIDRNSIKRNPRAGQTTSVERGSRTLDFDFEGKWPKDQLTDGKQVHITNWQGAKEPMDSIRCSGIVVNPDMFEELSKIPGMILHEKMNNTVIHHSPIPMFDYKYENPLVPCSECLNNVYLEDIDYEYDDDGNRSEYCPVCKEEGTFEKRWYEPIEDVVKELKLI